MFANSKSSTLLTAGLASSSGTVLDQLDALVGLRKPKFQRLTVRRDIDNGSKLKKKTKEEEEEEKRFIAAVNQILVQVPRDKIHTVWLRLFSERMNSSQTLTTPSQMEHYMSIFTDWLEVVPPSEANSVNRKLALAFLSGFASTHAIDPDNSIIGLQASEKAVAMAQKVRGEQQADYDSYAKLLRLEPGDLCIVKRANPERFTWARVSKVLPQSKIQVFFDPLENDSETISNSEAYPLGDQLVGNTGNIKLHEQLIFSPAEDFFAHLNTEIRSRSSQFMQDQGINVQFLRRLSRNEFSLSDLPLLKQVRSQLSKLLDGLESTDFFKSIKSYASHRVATFLQELKPEMLFPPTRNRVLEHLKVAQFAAFARVDLQKYIAVCDSTLDLIVLERRKLMSGETKNYLTEWWLHLIRDEVERWLNEQGYDHEAVPYNYIEQAPTSLDICRKNLQLLQSILSTLGDKSQPVHTMITRLKNEIYPKIEEFIEKSQLVICEHLGLEQKDFTPQLARTTLEAKIKDGSMKDAQVNDPLSNLILDLEYLQEMKHLEDHPPTAGGLKLGVVPISGVIVGYFYRYENELITVLDVWGGGSQPAASPPPPNPSMIEQSLAAVTRNRAPSAIDAANLTDNAYLGENLKREQISFLRLSSMNVTARKEFISEQSQNTERLRRSHQEGFRQRTESEASAEDSQLSQLLNEFAELQNKQLQILKQLTERDDIQRATIRKLRLDLARQQEKEFSAAATAIAANPAKKVVLNVGGTKYTTTVDTFAREPDSQLSHLVGSARYDTEVFIDRDGAVFAHILNYLRDGSIVGLSDDLRAQMAREAKFFGLSKLLALIDTTLGKLSPKVPALANPKSGAASPSVSSAAVPRVSAPGTGTLPREPAAATAAAAVSTQPRTQSVAVPSPAKEAKTETPGGPSSRPPSEQSPAAATIASSEAKAHTLTIPAQFVGNAVATHWYQFLHSAQVPEDACISYSLLFMDKNVKPEQVASMSQQNLKDIGVKMGHIMKIQKAKVPQR